jgi:hypothetical protein
MYGTLKFKLILAAAIISAVFMSGWFVNGLRWESKYTSLQKEYAEAVVEANRKARRQEQILQSKADIEMVNKNAEIQTIRSELDRALDELRKRPARSGLPGSTCNSQGATGAQLSREDAEFLARESARADAIRAALNYCYTLYEEAKRSLSLNIDK